MTGTYPITDVQDAYDAAAQGTLAVGNQTLNYETTATLLGMRQVNVYAVGPKVVQRWEINSEGSIAGVQNAAVEVSAVLDRTTAPVFSYAAFGISDACDPPGLTFGGDSSTDSYDSSTTGCSGATIDTSCGLDPDSGGNIGTNGSMDVIGGSVEINGSLSTPRAGVGSCEENAAIDNPDVLLGDDPLIQLPQTLEFEDPAFPTPTPILTNQTLPNNSFTCPLIPGCSPRVPQQKNKFNLAPSCVTGPCPAGSTTYGNLSGGGGADKEIHLSAGTYNINSLDLGAQLTVIIDSGPVILNIAGCATLNADSTDCATYLDAPLSTNGGSFTNASMDSSDLQIRYAGTGELQMRGTSGLAAVVYAPNAHFETVGTTDFYGAVIANTVDLTGTANIHYDRALENFDLTLGNFILQAFTWKKF